MTAAFGLVGAAAMAAPAQAQAQWTPPALELISASCTIDGEWALEWSLTDTTGTVDEPEEYTYTVAEIITQIGADSGPWEDAVLEGALQVGAVLPHTGEGSLIGVQIVPGDTERVKLKAQSDRTVPVVDGRRNEGRGLKNSLQHAVELGDCSVPAPPEPEDVPELDVGVGIVIADDIAPEPEEVGVEAEWVVDFSLPEDAPDTTIEYEILADVGIGDGGNNDVTVVGQVDTGDSTLRIPVSGPVQEVELVALELVVDDGDGDSEAMLLEAELPAIDPGTGTGTRTGSDPTTPADPDRSTPTAQPTLPTTGVPVGVTVGAAGALIAAGAFVLSRARARKRHEGAS
ncbi:hypothetical protein [Glycomyces rhizosphaerae]|uniref:LPXTG cell wall anchor domain-containing protein n=1 Tax=Glycomyces rhizosphaerae TaxID=2054422 RepID=A0ABV7Q280_9ACTN